MEHEEGGSLADRLERGALPLEQVLRYGAETAGALDKAHRSGIVHWDLKPGNVVLTKSGVKLLDFGLAPLRKDADAELSELSSLPTQGKPLTQEGTLRERCSTWRRSSWKEIGGRAHGPLTSAADERSRGSRPIRAGPAPLARDAPIF